LKSTLKTIAKYYYLSIKENPFFWHSGNSHTYSVRQGKDRVIWDFSAGKAETYSLKLLRASWPRLDLDQAGFFACVVHQPAPDALYCAVLSIIGGRGCHFSRRQSRPLQGGIIHSPPHGPSSGHRGIVVRRTTQPLTAPRRSLCLLIADVILGEATCARPCRTGRCTTSQLRKQRASGELIYSRLRSSTCISFLARSSLFFRHITVKGEKCAPASISSTWIITGNDKSLPIASPSVCSRTVSQHVPQGINYSATLPALFNTLPTNTMTQVSTEATGQHLCRGRRDLCLHFKIRIARSSLLPHAEDNHFFYLT